MDKNRISEILSDAITEGNYAMELLASKLRESCDSLEELGDVAYDAGVALRELVIKMKDSNMEDEE